MTMQTTYSDTLPTERRGLSSEERRWLSEVSDGAWVAGDREHHAMVARALEGDADAIAQIRRIPRSEGGLNA